MHGNLELIARSLREPPAAVDERRIQVQTSACFDAVDLTGRVEDIVAASSIERGLVFVQSLHTTAAIVVNEDEPLLWEDIRGTLERLAPLRGRYRHDDFAVRTVNMTPDEMPNGHAHCKALFLPTSVALAICGGRLVLGRWQRVFLLELDRARPRTVAVLAQGVASPSGLP
jgi:secondary thiamine-phosphate synthase enzyme